MTARDFPYVVPSWSRSPDEIAEWFAENRVALLVQAFGGSLSYILLIWLFAGLGTLLEAARPAAVEVKVITPLAVAFAVSIMTSNNSQIVALLAGTPGHPRSPREMHHDFELTWVTLLSGCLFAALLLVATAVAVARTGSLPMWTAWSAALLSPLLVLSSFCVLAGTGWLAPGSLPVVIPPGLFFVWTTAVGVTLVRMSSQSARPGALRVGAAADNRRED